MPRGWRTGRVVLALALSGGAGVPATSAADDATSVAVAVVERANSVRLRIHAPANLAPDSIEVQLDGRSVAVRARTVSGQAVHSPIVRLRRAVVEEGAAAVYEGEGWVIVTLRRRPRVRAEP